MLTALASLFTQRPVRPALAMSGEITLRGKVLPVGGIKEKVLAAVRAGITTIVLCKDNQKDVSEIDAAYIEGITFQYVTQMSEVLALTLLPEPAANAKVMQPQGARGKEQGASPDDYREKSE
jgi:ATP-dependent Lon protease